MKGKVEMGRKKNYIRGGAVKHANIRGSWDDHQK